MLRMGSGGRHLSMTGRARFPRVAAAAIALFAVLAFAAMANANTYNVNTTKDVTNAGGTSCQDSDNASECSLRAAIDASNNNGGSNTIVVPAGRYDRTIAPDRSDVNSAGGLHLHARDDQSNQGQTLDPNDVAARVVRI